MNQLANTLSDANEDYVNVIPVDKNSFYNWDEFFTKELSYKKAIKDCSKYHCFYYDVTQKGKVYKNNTVLNNTVTRESIHNQYDNQLWKQQIQTLFPNLEKAPGIAGIKKVELYTKWRKLIPNHYQDSMCPKPDDSVLLKIKRAKAKKAKDKLIEKKQRLNQNNSN